MWILVALFVSLHTTGVYSGSTTETDPVLFRSEAACNIQLPIEEKRFADKIDQYGPVMLICMEYDDDMKEAFPIKPKEFT